MSGGGSDGGRSSGDSSGDVQSVSERMRSFGFEVDEEQWSEQTRRDAVAVLDQWELDRTNVTNGVAVDADERQEVPDWLVGCEATTPDQVIAASQAGRLAAEDINNETWHNPYVINTSLWDAWDESLNAESRRRDGTGRSPGRLFNKQETLTQLHAKLADAYAERRSKRAEVSKLDAAKNAAAKEWRKADANCESVAQEIEDLLSGNYQIPLIDDEE